MAAMADPGTALLCLLTLLVTVLAAPSDTKLQQPLTLIKKSAAAASGDYPDYQTGVKYDEYPVSTSANMCVLCERR